MPQGGSILLTLNKFATLRHKWVSNLLQCNQAENSSFTRIHFTKIKFLNNCTYKKSTNLNRATVSNILGKWKQPVNEIEILGESSFFLNASFFSSSILETRKRLVKAWIIFYPLYLFNSVMKSSCSGSLEKNVPTLPFWLARFRSHFLFSSLKEITFMFSLHL